MSDQGTSPVHIAGVLARATATGLIGAAMSAERHPVAMRRMGLVVAAGLGAVAGLAAAGIVPLTDREDGQRLDQAEGERSPIAAAALGVATFALTAGVSEVGLRTQRRFERWADAAFGRPRLAVGLANGAISIVLDLADDRIGPDEAIRSAPRAHGL
ncbi:hypothetical protein [Janibacter limosus]|uniref:hypothetical protein n=1 Tax=Janibacter limosus TaxID=53458 RepID=UPI00082BC9B8|nr:hypothetical protein [Janibacter limosus]